ncbi:MAG: SHOCT domain-containing protein [Methylocella sp.]
MQGLTPEGQRIVDDIARRHGFSADAVTSLLYALAAGNGTQAQFNHPEFGGMGQWSPGMIMIGDMFNQGLKARVESLCRDLADLLRGQQVFETAAERPEAANSWQTQNYQAQNYNVSGAAVSLFAQGFGTPSRNWWPTDLRSPTSTGSQNDMHYAYFPSSNRLAIKQGGRIRVYDSGDHHISGVSQQQGDDQSLTFTSQYGVVRLGDLKLVSTEDGEAPSQSSEAAAPSSQNIAPQNIAPQAAAPTSPGAPETPRWAQPPEPPPVAPQPASPASGAQTPADIFSTLERLAELRQKNILSEEEFAAKKAELLARL